MSLGSFAFLVSSVAALSLTVGCAEGAVDDDAESSESALTTDQVGTDAQVLQIWTAGKAFPLAAPSWIGSGPSDVNVDAGSDGSCMLVRRWESSGSQAYESRDVDCTRALGRAAPFDGAAGPVMTPVRFVITKRVSDGYLSGDPDYCSRVEVRIVVRDAAVAQPSFAGIGFWTSRGESFTPKAFLQAVGHTRLASGDEATVYRFTGISTCISSAHQSTSGNTYQTFSFKPYAAFDKKAAGDDREVMRYRVWENVSSSHTIGRSWPGAVPQIDALGFDRQNDLLAH